MNVRSLFVAIVVLVVAGAAFAQAPPPPREIGQTVILEGAEALHPEDDHPQAREAVIRFLELEEGQIVQWDGLVAELRLTVEPLREEQREVGRALRELLAGEDPDPSAVGELVLEGKTLDEAVRAAYRTYVEGFHEILAPEQGERLAFVRKAERVQPVIPAFRLVGLIAPR